MASSLPSDPLRDSGRGTDPGSRREGDVRRSRRKRVELSCPTCGAGNRLARGVLERGFQHCSHCGSAMPVDGAGGFAFKSPSGCHTRVVAPGRSLFVLLLGRVLTVPVFLLVLVIGNLVATGADRALTRAGHRSAATAILLAFAATCVATLGLLLVEQRILVTENRVEIWWKAFGLTLRHRRFGTHGLRMDARERWPRSLRLQPAHGPGVRVGTERDGEATELRLALEQAIAEARVSVAAETVTCPGCGGPVATPARIRDKGGLDCPHCGCGVVAVEGGVVVGPCVLGHDLYPARARPRTRTERGAGFVEWDLRSEFSLRPLVAAASWLALAAFGAGFAGLGAFVAWKSEGWRAVGLLVAAFLIVTGGALFVGGLAWQFGRNRLRVDSTVLEHQLLLGPFRLRRRLVALPRLLALRVVSTPSDVDLDVETALEEFKIALPHRLGEAEAVALELLEELRARVEALKRAVSTAAPRKAGSRRRD